MTQNDQNQISPNTEELKGSQRNFLPCFMSPFALRLPHRFPSGTETLRQLCLWRFTLLTSETLTSPSCYKSAREALTGRSKADDPSDPSPPCALKLCSCSRNNISVEDFKPWLPLKKLPWRGLCLFFPSVFTCASTQLEHSST